MPGTGFMIYGAYGYTGQLIARQAVARGHRPLLAGRDRVKLGALARELDLPCVSVSLEERSALLRAKLRRVHPRANPRRDSWAPWWRYPPPQPQRSRSSTAKRTKRDQRAVVAWDCLSFVVGLEESPLQDDIHGGPAVATGNGVRHVREVLRRGTHEPRRGTKV